MAMEPERGVRTKYTVVLGYTASAAMLATTVAISCQLGTGTAPGFGNRHVRLPGLSLPPPPVDTGDICREDDPDLPVMYADLDGDYYGDPDAVYVGCDPPPGYVGQAGDCNDGDARAYEGAPEVVCDGIDNDCDGYEPACDFPLVSDAASSVVRGAPGQDLRSGAWSVGDIDGDARDDLLLRDEGSHVALLTGPHLDAGLLEGRDPSLTRMLLPTEPTRAVAAGDVDHDGASDVWVEGLGPRHRRDRVVHLIAGGDGVADGIGMATVHNTLGVAGAGFDALAVRTGAQSVSILRDVRGDLDAAEDATLRLHHSECGGFGDVAEFVGDIDGDGVEDLLVGASRRAHCDDPTGTYGFILTGTLEGEVDPHLDGEHLARITGNKSRRRRATLDTRGLGDVNGDGHADLGVLHREGLAIIHGPLSGTYDASVDSDLELARPEQMPADVAGVEAVVTLDVDETPHVAAIFRWPSSRNLFGLFDASGVGVGPEPKAVLVSEDFGPESGITNLQVMDADGDGLDDLVVSAGSSEPGHLAGRVYLLLNTAL